MGEQKEIHPYDCSKMPVMCAVIVFVQLLVIAKLFPYFPPSIILCKGKLSTVGNDAPSEPKEKFL
jgi:hypothetical protein